MASRYRAYRPDHGETIDDAKYSEADSVREAAKLYAERIWPSCDYPSSIDVVIVEPDGAEWEVAPSTSNRSRTSTRTSRRLASSSPGTVGSERA